MAIQKGNLYMSVAALKNGFKPPHLRHTYNVDVLYHIVHHLSGRLGAKGIFHINARQTILKVVGLQSNRSVADLKTVTNTRLGLKLTVPQTVVFLGNS